MPPAIIPFLLALPGPCETIATAEPLDARLGRWTTIGLAWAEVQSSPPPEWPFSGGELATAGVILQWFESGRFDRAVHSGEQRGDRGASTCLGQLQRSGWVSDAEWRSATGVDAEATRVCVGLTARVLARHAVRCRLDGERLTERHVAALYGAYGTGRTCTPELGWAKARARVWTRAVERSARDK